MLTAEPKQFKLSEDGYVLFQPDSTNPLPGRPVALLRKGAAILSPDCDVLENEQTSGIDRAAVSTKIHDWLRLHIDTVLESLVILKKEEGMAAPVKEIATRIYDAMGVVPRQELEDFIKILDPDMRKDLRQRNVKLGPVLVFVPTLNKPAAVRLRALLWALWRGHALPPALMPSDGMVSFSVEGKDHDPVFLRTIGYPVYGPRAVRIDMLDRVISAVYDTAKQGQFKAKHEMAEWLGCSIPDLYAVLEAMGHQKIAEPPPVETAPAPATDTEPQQPAPEVSAVVEKPKEAIKPELASFRLKRGAASAEKERRPARGPEKTSRPVVPKDRGDKDKNKDKKPGAGRRPRPADKKKPERDGDREISVISASMERKMENSPFAVLQQLKARDGK